MAEANLLRVSILGAMPNGEVWSVNPVWAIGGGTSFEAVTAAQCVTMATAINAITISAGLTSAMYNLTTFTGTRVEARQLDGTLISLGEVTRGAAIAGTGTTAHPYQTSLVTSLRTAGVGASGRGRLYWPATGIAMNNTNLRANAASVASVNLGVKTYLTSITAALEVTMINDMHLAVWSRTKEALEWVTSLQCGDVLDTQRRRRDQLIETFNVLTYP